MVLLDVQEHAASTSTVDIVPCTDLSAMLMLNIQGMSPDQSSKSFWKIPYLEEFIQDSTEFIPFLSVTETWTKTYMKNAQMKINSYEMFRSDRKLRKRGGVALYIHNSITVSDFWSYDNKFCEAAIALLEADKTVLVSVYRPQNSSLADFKNTMNFIEEKIKSLGDSYTIIVTGDFNFPNICWESLSVHTGTTTVTADSARCLLHFMEKYLLNQEISIPTRLNNILDLFLTNKHDLVLDVFATKSSISDHNVMKIPLAYSFGHPSLKKKDCVPHIQDCFHSLDFSKANYELLSSLFEAIDWDSMFVSCDPGSFSSEFHSKVLSICLQNVPAETQSKVQKKKYCKQCSKEKETIV